MMSMVYDHYNTVMYNTVMLILVIHVRNENYFYYGGGRYFLSLKSMYLFQFGIVMNSKMIWPRYEEKPETHYHPYLLSFLILIEVKLLDNGI